MKGFRFYSFITITAIVIFQVSCASSSTASDETFPSKSKAEIAAVVEKSDQHFADRDENVSNLREAARLLKQVRNPDQRDFEIEWKYARCNYFLGKRSDDEQESTAAYQEGLLAGQIASRLEPNKPDGYFWFGANLGEQSKRSPLTLGLTKVDEIREAMLKVVELQPDYQAASAYGALAEIEMATGMIGGKPEKAVEFLEKALKIEENNTNLYLHLGKAYLAVDRDADAKKQLLHLSKMKPAPGYQFEYDACTAEAKKLLETRF